MHLPPDARALAIALILIAGLASAPGQENAPRAEPVTPGSDATSGLSPDIQVVSPSTAQYERAKMLYDQKQFGPAIVEYTAFLKANPGDARGEEALYRVADSYRQLKRTADAQAAFAYFLTRFPNSLYEPAVRLRLGDLCFNAKDYAKAIEALSGLTSNNDPTVKLPATYLLGRSYLAANETARGLPLLESLASAQPPSAYAPHAAQALAENAEKRGDFAAAEKFWEKTLTLSPSKVSQATAAARGGWAAVRAGHFKEAELLFETCRRLDPGVEWRRVANSGLLRALSRQKKYAELVQLIEQEHDNFLPESRGELLFSLGQAEFELKQYQAAAATFDGYLAEFGSEEGAPSAAYQRLIARMNVNRGVLEADANAFLTAYPTSPFAPTVLLLLAQDLSQRQKFAEALPLWEKLAQTKSDKNDLPKEKILFELARCDYELQKWLPAAEIYDRFCQEFPQSALALAARTRQAIALQKAAQPDAAIAAWEKVRAAAAAKSNEREMALEQLGLLYSQKNDIAKMTAAFTELLAEFPASPVRALASYSIGAAAFDAKNYAAADPALRHAREWDPAAWTLPATMRLALLSFYQKNIAKAVQYAEEYEQVAKGNEKAPRLPAAFYFGVGQASVEEKRFAQAVAFFSVVTAHPQAGEFGVPAWWALAESQRAIKQYKNAIVSYNMYRKLKPDLANASQVLLALAQADVGAAAYDDAKALAEQVMIQEPEGANNTLARLILGDVFYGKGDYAAAAKAYAALALLYDDPNITPKAMRRASDSFAKAGDMKSAESWRGKLKAKYPNAEENQP